MSKPDSYYQGASLVGLSISALIFGFILNDMWVVFFTVVSLVIHQMVVNGWLIEREDKNE